MATKKANPSVIGMYYEAKYRAEDDVRTLARAQDIMNDPKRLAAAKKCAKEKLTEMQAVTNLGAK